VSAGRVIFLRVPAELHQAVAAEAEAAGATIQATAVELLRQGLTVPVRPAAVDGQLVLVLDGEQ